LWASICQRVDGLGRDAQDEAIVESILALARTLNMTVTAEGVETAAQHAYLRGLGCERAQGYLYARPLPPAELAERLANERALKEAA
jgi:EAL domain-containing protein (putative c-di-GMP-specific phosphodiesterase class I)